MIWYFKILKFPHWIELMLKEINKKPKVNGCRMNLKYFYEIFHSTLIDSCLAINQTGYC